MKISIRKWMKESRENISCIAFKHMPLRFLNKDCNIEMGHSFKYNMETAVYIREKVLYTKLIKALR